jgi:hypothetical protein
MLKLKVLFVMGIVVFVLVMCAFAPGICIERFVLPDGCCTSCVESSSPCLNLCMAEEGRGCGCR